MVVVFEIPVRTVSEANRPRGEHWGTKSRRVKSQRFLAKFIASGEVGKYSPETSKTITLTRIGPRKLDTDNLASSLKACRDGIADALGINDGDDRLTWLYKQEPGRRNRGIIPAEYNVRVKIEEVA